MTIETQARRQASRENFQWIRELLLALALGFLSIASSFAFTTEASVSTLIRQGNLSGAEQRLRKTLTQNPRDASALTLLGEVRVRQRKYKQAEGLYRQAVQANSKLAPAYEHLGNLYTDEQRVDDAIAAYETLLKLQPQNQKAKAKLAALYQRNGNARKSLHLAQTIPLAGRPEQLLPVIAADYLALNQPDKGQEIIAQILRRAPGNPDLVPQLATIFLRHGRAGDAAELLRIAGDHQKVTTSFLAALATAQSAQGHPDEAKQTITRALALDPNHADALFEQARQEGVAGDWAAAAMALKRTLEIGAPRIDVLQSLVFASMQIDDLQTAHDAALDLYELTPERKDSALALGVVLVRGSHWGEAKLVLEKMLAAYPDDKRAQLAMGMVQYNMGNLEPAAQLLTASLGQGAADAEAHYMLGLVAKQRGDLQTAANQMETALSINPSQSEALSALGQLYLQLNQPEKARPILEKAVSRLPDDSQSHYQLGLAYRKLGMPDQAREQLELFQKLSVRKVPQPPGEGVVSPK